METTSLSLQGRAGHIEQGGWVRGQCLAPAQLHQAVHGKLGITVPWAAVATASMGLGQEAGSPHQGKGEMQKKNHQAISLNQYSCGGNPERKVWEGAMGGRGWEGIPFKLVSIVLIFGIRSQFIFPLSHYKTTGFNKKGKTSSLLPH